MSSGLHLTEWLSAAADSTREIAQGPLGIVTAVWREGSALPVPDDLYGVYIPLSSDGLALQFGLLAERRVCAKLASALIGLTADESLDSDEDVFDAVGEVTNLVAGGIKVRVAGRVNVSVGLPLALRGKVFPSTGSQSIHGVMCLDEADVWLVLTGTSTNRR